jgi:hypothetical protein
MRGRVVVRGKEEIKRKIRRWGMKIERVIFFWSASLAHNF